ncbi:MAG: metallophosphoesterase [Lachnospiraceae bacterium]|jgi:predicted MPP superfamily phosphohydrolase|nr:metallophosphoesterase [Lachnospiraceae bacterium]
MYILLVFLWVLLNINVWTLWLMLCRSGFFFESRSRRKKEVRARNAGAAIIVAVLSAGMATAISWSYTAAFELLACGVVITEIVFAVSEAAAGHFSQSVKKRLGAMRISGIPAVAIALFLMIFGFVNVLHVSETDYSFRSSKLHRSYTVVFLADVHYQTAQPLSILQDSVSRINALSPDIIVLGGDITDEFSTDGELQECYEELGKLHASCGVYYIYGNHDRKKSARPLIPHYTQDELKHAIASRGIRVLEDKSVGIGDDLLLTGREDYSWPDKADAKTLLADTNPSRYRIVLSHQPKGAADISAQGADLMLSGHTHGGGLFPLQFTYPLFGSLTQGRYTFGNMTEITSVGLSSWGAPCKTAAKCEYLVIRLSPE